MSTTNLEEAATVAAEFVSSLENLPGEIQHLLAEIRFKDIRTQELQIEIQKEGSKYIRHSNRNPGQPLPPKDATIPQLVRSHYAEINQLATEKEKLAERIVQLIHRAQSRLEIDYQKVLRLQGETDETIPLGPVYIGASRNPVAQINESLRSALASTPVAEPIVASISPAVPVAPPPQKKRKVTASASAGSIKLPSPAPAVTSVSTSGSAIGQRSRLSQQIHPRQSPARHRRAIGLGSDEENEELEAEDESGELEDQELYCFCQKLSYGEMIACDATDCHYQWFHLPCVNLKPPLPDRWYCSECMQRLGVSNVGVNERQRKGRKK